MDLRGGIVSVKNSVIVNNSAGYQGGGIGYRGKDSLSIENCTFARNKASENSRYWPSSRSADIYISDGGYTCDLSVLNSIFFAGSKNFSTSAPEKYQYSTYSIVTDTTGDVLIESSFFKSDEVMCTDLGEAEPDPKPEHNQAVFFDCKKLTNEVNDSREFGTLDTAALIWDWDIDGCIDFNSLGGLPVIFSDVTDDFRLQAQEIGDPLDSAGIDAGLSDPAYYDPYNEELYPTPNPSTPALAPARNTVLNDMGAYGGLNAPVGEERVGCNRTTDIADSRYVGSTLPDLT